MAQIAQTLIVEGTAGGMFQVEEILSLSVPVQQNQERSKYTESDLQKWQGHSLSI